jgi:hypothetical protein
MKVDGRLNAARNFITLMPLSINSRIPSITTGEILMEEFLIPMNISAYTLAKDTNAPDA